jgi:hypothetical protein
VTHAKQLARIALIEAAENGKPVRAMAHSDAAPTVGRVELSRHSGYFRSSRVNMTEYFTDALAERFVGCATVRHRSRCMKRRLRSV